MAITKRELEKLKNEFDPEAREYFLGMEREDQLAVLFSIGASNSNRLAIVERRQIDFETDVRQYRRERERKENGDEGDDKMSTTQKIVKMIEEERAKQFNFPLWFRDRVLPGIVQLVTLALLYFIFGEKVPTP